MEFAFKHKPFEHQLTEWKEHRNDEYRGILWEQGTGKSKLIIDTAAWLWAKGEIDGILVVAPNGVHRNWTTDEFPEHIPEGMKHEVKSLGWKQASASTVWQKNAVGRLIKHRGFAALTMSYDAFVTPKGKAVAKEFLTKRRALYVLDESVHIKSPGATRTRTIMGSSTYGKYRRILTGTPVTKGPFDLYPQIKFLDKTFWAERGFPDFNVYKHHFGLFRKVRLRGGRLMEKDDKRRPDKQWEQLLSYRNLDQLATYIDPITTRVLKKDVLDLPPKLYSKRYYEPTFKQRQVYEQLRDEFMAELHTGETIYAALAIVRLLRFQQVLCNYVPTADEGEEPYVEIDDRNPRLDVLMEAAHDTPHKMIVWARFTRDIDLIMDRCAKEGVEAVRYDGKITDDEAEANRIAFQRVPMEEEGPQVFVGNPAKGSEGLTLTQAQTVVYYNNSFRYRDRVQSEDRAHRIGQDNKVYYIDICAPGTIDFQVIENLRNKYDIASQITGDELKEWI